MYEYIMIRYGDLTLKGKNKSIFKQKLNNQIRFKLDKLNVDFEFQHDLVYIKLNDVEADIVIDILDTIAGISSYSKVVKCEYDFAVMAEKGIELVNDFTKGRLTTFKIETKRANKNLPLTSIEISQKLSGMVLSNVDNLKVDVRNPELTLNVEVRKDATYLYTNRIPGMGGFPVSIGGKGMVMLSGGIDSPVSAYLAMKKGLEVECIHYESTPMTSIESAQKVIDLTEILARYAPKLKIKLHMVPFQKLHEQIIINTSESYVITIMRRMMYRIATEVAKLNDCQVLITGDSIGQVASQTIESMSTIQDVTNLIIVRPLSTYDKMEIVKIATKIDTLKISIKPFSDCCTVYVPKRPVIKPTVKQSEFYETKYDYTELLEESIANTKTIILDSREHLDIQSKGLIVSECI
ncbi:MAG: tRNA 4-thiouridine(8) synthase ThiI [Tenericutes bacterium]|nr:tRNA 4-thiouridine(8) synthase ThiI [Mycoplasmatota bacterium]